MIAYKGAFNEGIRLKECVEYQQQLTGVEVKRLGADSIYANNENRRYCTEKGIITNFVRKGPKPKEQDVDLRTATRIIGALRATVMERNFGNQKQHYSFGRISGKKPTQRDPVAFLRHPHGKRRDFGRPGYCPKERTGKTATKSLIEKI